MPLPTFLIVGTMKGGTSALTRAIKNHPDVYVPGGKEMHFFDRHHDRGADWYAALFDGAPAGATIGEGTPYMYDGDAMIRMADLLPDVRCVVILRNPVDRAHSHYWHNVRRDREERSFATAVESEREEGPSAPVYAYLGQGRYAPQLRHIEKLIGRDQMLVLANEDLRRQRAETLRQMWGFIGVDPLAGDVEEARRPFRWHLRNRLSARRRVRNAGYPPLDPALRDELTTEFEPDVAAVEEWWARDLTAWKG